MHNAWFILALMSALCWGISYSFADKIMAQGISPAFLLLLQGIITFPVYFIVAYFSNTLATSLSVLQNPHLLGMALIATTALIVGNLLILTSIDMKNATLAGLLEISYPFFTFLTAWIVFKEVQLNWNTAAGGALILSGVLLIWMKN